MGVLAGDTAFLIGSAIEALLYGAYLVLVGYALMVLTWRRRTDRVDWVLLTFLIGMLLASTVHYFFGLNATVVGFIKHGEDVDGPSIYLASKAVGYPMDILLAINLILSDLTMLHRLWLVWQRRTAIIIIPFCIMVCYLVTFIYAVNLMAHGARDDAAAYAVVMRFCLTSFSLSLLFSVTVTTLLAYPIFKHIKHLSAVLPETRHIQQYRATILILVESGAIIALAQVINLTVFEIQYRTGHFIWELIGLPLTQLYCIGPSMIITRVGLGLASDQQAGTAAKTTELQFSSGGGTSSGTAVSLQNLKMRREWAQSDGGVHAEAETTTKADMA
ncbi:hypothetical protein EXIGLDRAFT_765378 [Exidia glandulosa HHB12029]|uniref:Uncharacterized protein n=1 Tax=Exidia glandulosa HHB12029 TaxID=1314781 RepID=A0A165KJ90_EXIGL|nr:hypothetical protein EXIGLDRAFT_765378 [Exidia glandulosa HHB12029]